MRTRVRSNWPHSFVNMNKRSMGAVNRPLRVFHTPFSYFSLDRSIPSRVLFPFGASPRSFPHTLIASRQYAKVGNSHRKNFVIYNHLFLSARHKASSIIRCSLLPAQPVQLVRVHHLVDAANAFSLNMEEQDDDGTAIDVSHDGWLPVDLFDAAL